MLRKKLLICLLILLLFGCSKVYECKLYVTPYCIANDTYPDYVNIKGYTEEDAESSCLEYKYIPVDIYGDTLDGGVFAYPQCCECGNPTPAIFGVEYVN